MTVCPPHDYAGPEPCPYCRRDLWKRLAKRCWQGWGYASKLQERTHAELEHRTAWSNEQFALLEAEFNKYKDRIEGLGAEVARLRAKYDKDLSDAEIAHQAEVARLREADATATKAIDTLTAMHATAARSAEQWHDKYATERAAHEATKAELEKAHDETWRLGARAEEAEARVAELEREHSSAILDAGHVNANLARLIRKQGETIDQARGLLGSAANVVEWQGWHDDYAAWLRAHPATATPAATGAEHVYRCPACGGPSGSPPPAEKEQGT